MTPSQWRSRIEQADGRPHVRAKLASLICWEYYADGDWPAELDELRAAWSCELDTEGPELHAALLRIGFSEEQAASFSAFRSDAEENLWGSYNRSTIDNPSVALVSAAVALAATDAADLVARGLIVDRRPIKNWPKPALRLKNHPYRDRAQAEELLQFWRGGMAQYLLDLCGMKLEADGIARRLGI
jgi:hypothetical protein